jgi:hypothetical protein
MGPKPISDKVEGNNPEIRLDGVATVPRERFIRTKGEENGNQERGNH